MPLCPMGPMGPMGPSEIEPAKPGSAPNLAWVFFMLGVGFGGGCDSYELRIDPLRIDMNLKQQHDCKAKSRLEGPVLWVPGKFEGGKQ